MNQHAPLRRHSSGSKARLSVLERIRLKQETREKRKTSINTEQRAALEANLRKKRLALSIKSSFIRFGTNCLDIGTLSQRVARSIGYNQLELHTEIINLALAYPQWLAIENSKKGCFLIQNPTYTHSAERDLFDTSDMSTVSDATTIQERDDFAIV